MSPLKDCSPACGVLTLVLSKEFIPGYFGAINTALNSTGAACIQVITIPESRFDDCEHPYALFFPLASY